MKAVFSFIDGWLGMSLLRDVPAHDYELAAFDYTGGWQGSHKLGTLGRIDIQDFQNS
jgi:hypothetical protein